jgi:hypothetical protein
LTTLLLLVVAVVEHLQQGVAVLEVFVLAQR